MRKKSKQFLYIMSALTMMYLTPAIAQAGNLNPDPPAKEEKSGGMKSWTPTHSKKSEESKKPAPVKSVDENDLSDAERAIIEDLEQRLEKDRKENNSNRQENADKKKERTPEEKLWEKYKALAQKHAKEENLKIKEETEKERDKNAEKSSDNDNTESSIEDAETAEKEEESNGLKGILDRYKKTQKNKGNMNSRSFGNID